MESKVSMDEAAKNLSGYSMNDAIGSSHWFNTLMASVLHIGEFMKTHDRVHFNETLQKDWGEMLYNVAKDMMKWRENKSGAEWQKNQEPQGMKWVKASERLPEPFKSVIVKSYGRVGVGKNMKHFTMLSCEFTGWNNPYQDVKFNDVEWLDETTSPVQETKIN